MNVTSEGKKIMIVEDEAIVARDLSGMISQMGYTVTNISSNGADALRIAQENPPDLVLMDINIKGDIDGITTAERLRKNSSVPVVYLTSYADEKTINRAKVTEPMGYIVKPFQRQDVYSHIEIALYRNRIDNLRGQRIADRMIEELSDGHMMWSLQDDTIYSSRRLAGTLSLTLSCKLAEYMECMHHSDRDGFTEAVNRHIEGQTDRIECEFRVRRADGEWRWLRLVGRRFRTPSGDYDFIAGMHYDVNDRRVAEEGLMFLVNHDPLTNLYNRMRLVDHLANRLDDLRSGLNSEPFAVVLADLDDVKSINDTEGRAAGDKAIGEVGLRFFGTLRGKDMAARVRGDEFVLVVDPCKNRAEAISRAEDLVAEIRKPINLDPNCSVEMNAAFGVAHSSEGFPTPDEMLEAADRDANKNRRGTRAYPYGTFLGGGVQ